MQKMQKDLFLSSPFLTRYKPYCIQVVSPIIETYLTTTLSLANIVNVKYPELPIDYRSVCLCIKNFISKMDDIYSLIMTELVEADLSWNLREDLRFLEIPNHLKRKLPKKRFLDLYRFFLIMEHYTSAVRSRKLEIRFLHSPWLLLANYILFINNYSTIF